MYTQQMEFRKVVEHRDLGKVEESVKRLKCPVVVLDGTLPVDDNIRKVAGHMRKHINESIRLWRCIFIRSWDTMLPVI